MVIQTLRKPDKFVWFSDAIQIQDHLTTGQELSIRKLDLSGIRLFTVFKFIPLKCDNGEHQKTRLFWYSEHEKLA